MKKIVLFLSFVFLFLGCSDKETKKETNTSSPLKAGKIEVVQNDNFKEEKVQVKAKDANESKVFYYDYNNADKNMSQKEDKT